VLRAQVELKSREQQLISERNELANRRLCWNAFSDYWWARSSRSQAPPTYEPPPKTNLEETLRRAYVSRADYQSALAKRRPQATIRPSPPQLITAIPESTRPTLTLDATASLNIPVFQGNRVHGGVLQAESVLRQARELLENLRAQIDQGADLPGAFAPLDATGQCASRNFCFGHIDYE